MPDYDLLIRGGRIVDGSGGPSQTGDVGIKDGRIVTIGTISGTARETIDADGLIVTPGFVDIHTHYDGQAIWSEELSPSSSHGVTSVVMGNCGVGFAPCRSHDHAMLIEVMEGVEDIPGVVMAEGQPWNWESFAEYLDALEACPRDIDVGALLPHSPLRVYAMGERGARGEVASAEDLALMQALTREALEAGALGFATSRLGIHRTSGGDQIPSHAAAIAELEAISVAMAEAGGRAGKGVLQIVLDAPFARMAEDYAMLEKLVERSGLPATFTFATANDGAPDWEPIRQAAEAANARGLSIAAQILPRPVGIVAGFELSTHPFCLCHGYQAIADLSLDEKLVHLRDPAFRKRLLAEQPISGHPLAMISRNYDWIFPLGDPPNYEPPLETSIAAQARAQGRSPEAVAYDLLMDGGGGNGMLYNALGNYYQGRLDALFPWLDHPDMVIGLGDGGAHYGAICDASYTTFVMTYWVRDRAGPRLPLERAVRALTARPAAVMGLHDRGLLRPGYKADINVIDLERLALHCPHISHDLPGGGRRLDQAATGYVATICNGVVIRRDDAPTGARPGRVIRGRVAAHAPLS